MSPPNGQRTSDVRPFDEKWLERVMAVYCVCFLALFVKKGNFTFLKLTPEEESEIGKCAGSGPRVHLETVDRPSKLFQPCPTHLAASICWEGSRGVRGGQALDTGSAAEGDASAAAVVVSRAL